MTVAELISLLQMQPQDARVRVVSVDQSYSTITIDWCTMTPYHLDVRGDWLGAPPFGKVVSLGLIPE